MKLLIEVANKDHLLKEKADGIILALKDFSVESVCFYTIEEITEICNQFDGEIFIKINKNLMNDEIEKVRDILIQLDKLNVVGVFFYDLAILELKRELKLDIDLIWNQTHMVHNYRTCDYYYSKGVKYALLGKELTLEEIIEIIKESKITSMVEVVSKPSIAFSKRKLITHYGKDLGEEVEKEMIITEKVSNKTIKVIEDVQGTSFFLDTVTNGTGIISDLYKCNCPYVIIREYGIEDCFLELVSDTMRYINDECIDSSYVDKYKKLGDYTNFFFKKTIYKVK